MASVPFGGLLSQQIPPSIAFPVALIVGFVALIVIAAISYFYVGVDTIVVGVDQFKMFLNWIIVAGCVGGCLGLFLRNRKLRQADGQRA